MIEITQGEAFEIECTIVTDDDATEITPALIEALSIKLGRLRKTWPDGEIYYDDAWIFPVSQEESMRLKGTPVLSAKCRFYDGTAPSCEFGVVVVRKGHDRRKV